jgi:hypothetical protein
VALGSTLVRVRVVFLLHRGGKFVFVRVYRLYDQRLPEAVAVERAWYRAARAIAAANAAGISARNALDASL